MTRFSGISLHFQKRISGNFYRTVCFDEVVFIMAGCFFIAFEFVRNFTCGKFAKFRKNVSENPPASPVYMKGKLSEHKGGTDYAEQIIFKSSRCM